MNLIASWKRLFATKTHEMENGKMDTVQPITAREKAVRLRHQIMDLDVRKQNTETKLSDEHAAIRRLALRRGQLVESLIGAPGLLVHREIDELDSTIRVGERMTESLQKQLSKFASEILVLNAELAEEERVVAAQEHAKALEAFQIQLTQATRRAADSLDAARLDFGALHGLAATGIERFGINALRICEPAFFDFLARQTNLADRGLIFELQGYQNNAANGVFIRPMRKA
jgi:hypothetical protein